MSYAGRYSVQAPSVSGISDSIDSDLPPSCRIPEYYVEPTEARRCSCGVRLSRYNFGPLCFACKIKAQDPDKVYSRETSPHFNNTSGFKGVQRCGNKWKAQRQIDGLKRHIGCYNTPEEAHIAWLKARPVAESRSV